MVTFSKQFSRAQTPIVYQVNPPSGVPGKNAPSTIGIFMNPFNKAYCKLFSSGGWSPEMEQFSFLSDAVLKTSVNLCFLFILVWFHFWALLLCYVIDNRRNPNRKRKRGQHNQATCCQRMEGLEIIIVCNFVISLT